MSLLGTAVVAIIGMAVCKTAAGDIRKDISEHRNDKELRNRLDAECDIGQVFRLSISDADRKLELAERGLKDKQFIHPFVPHGEKNLERYVANVQRGRVIWQDRLAKWEAGAVTREQALEWVYDYGQISPL